MGPHWASLLLPMASAEFSCPLRSAWKVQEGFIPMCSVLGALHVTPLFVYEGTDGGHFGKSLPYYSMAPHSVNVHILSKHLLGTF